ncbi:STAS domain-containing protein [Vulcaniibacterium tengchongense]|uniref:Phospholipid transport system transporter-binding protein n=1 Tax=Vulcaniibacterium tengchongense TaxID=1273429 RepID=A0A3N4VC19_9GAMM|nr:STAS domain-containing protein [Vulcaniibacterium tengchongense]RPE80168.1 phospholipid transport system transporter-binding protein [Vulcaniibacterium tengchongense]
MSASVRQEGDALVFAGPLDRAAVAALWPRLRALAPPPRRFDLRAVEAVDSAGLALLAELAERAGGAELVGTPPGLAELRAAYRLDAGLAFAG